MRTTPNPNHIHGEYTFKKRDGTPGYHAPDIRYHSQMMLEALGLRPGGHLPPEGMPARIVNGVKVWVEPEPMTRTFNRAAGIKVRKSSKHRVMAECPSCKRHMSAGRLHQHVCRES